jgi:hypothetical protein
MQTEAEINNDILTITMLIQNKYPELSKYIAEMPVTIPDEARPHINLKILQDYCDSLNQLLNKYAPSHTH